MGNTVRSFAAAAALGFALLFFGPATSTARADHFGPNVSFSGHFPLPHGSLNVNVGHGPRFGRHRSFVRHRFARPFFARPYFARRPYRLVRVFVYDPYPRWIYRRVYYSRPYCGY